MFGVILVSGIQVVGDIVCLVLALLCLLKAKKFKLFFLLNVIAFLGAAFCDAYYDYYFRIARIGIQHSVSFAITLPVFIFQICQAYNWRSLIKERSIFFSPYNLPYFIFAGIVSAVLIYYFSTQHSLLPATLWYQSMSVTLDMLIWIFTIICLARATTYSIVLLALGCLMIVSADLTTRCLFVFEMHKLPSAGWIHSIWAAGVIVMAVGFAFSLKDKDFEFCNPKSLQVVFSAWISSVSLIVFIIGFFFLSFLKLSSSPEDLHSMLWNFPVALMFIMIFSVLSGNRFSHLVLSPIEYFLHRIRLFDSGFKVNNKIFPLKEIHEFKFLGNFIDSSFNKISNQLDREINISRQVAHDIRSPLSSLEIVIKRLPNTDERKYILLRDAVSHIRDIANNLEKSDHSQKNNRSSTQIAVLLDYVISDRRAAFLDQIEIIHNFNSEAYNFFVNVIPSEMKRILINIINNANEAKGSRKLKIKVFLITKNNQLEIIISDNGVGISEKLIDKLFERGVTTKEKGSGLGLSHAKEKIESWEGQIQLLPNSDYGTSVHISLPLCDPPSWFVKELTLECPTSIICVDDSISIFHGWSERFKSVNTQIDLQYCKSQEDLLLQLEEQHEFVKIYFVDYEFSGKNYTGVDLLNLILKNKSSAKKVFLVTSRSSEYHVQEFCEKNNIQMIPKYFVPQIPIRIL